MIKTYNLLDGGTITATSPEDFVTQLREGSRFDSECTNQEFMQNFTRRYRELHGVEIDVSSMTRKLLLLVFFLSVDIV